MPFLVFEGLDGTGKSTLMLSLEKQLQSLGLRTLRTKEPGGTPLGDEIREMILRREGPGPTPRTELLLYEAIRAQHVDQVILPALEKKNWILCDRFTASSLAFQAGGRSIDPEWVLQLNLFATQGLSPDLIILLDLSVEESRRRRHLRLHTLGEGEDRIESEADSFHERVRQSFLLQAQNSPQKWLVLQASQSQEQLLEQTLNYLQTSPWWLPHLKNTQK